MNKSVPVLSIKRKWSIPSIVFEFFQKIDKNYLQFAIFQCHQIPLTIDNFLLVVRTTDSRAEIDTKNGEKDPKDGTKDAKKESNDYTNDYADDYTEDYKDDVKDKKGGAKAGKSSTKDAKNSKKDFKNSIFPPAFWVLLVEIYNKQCLDEKLF